jgi:hypothetical protein
MLSVQLRIAPNVEENGLILTPAKKLYGVIERLNQVNKKLILMFDEAQSIFTAEQPTYWQRTIRSS